MKKSTKIDISKLSEEELKELKKEVDAVLQRPGKHIRETTDRIKNADFQLKMEYKNVQGESILLHGYHIRYEIVDPIYQLCDWTLGNYKMGGPGNKPRIIRERQINIKNPDVYYAMLEDLTQLVIKYNRLAFTDEIDILKKAGFKLRGEDGYMG